MKFARDTVLQLRCSKADEGQDEVDFCTIHDSRLGKTPFVLRVNSQHVCEHEISKSF